MFFFFSNQLGGAGSFIVSLLGTLVLAALVMLFFR